MCAYLKETNLWLYELLFGHCDQIPERNNLKEALLILAHGFRGFSPLCQGGHGIAAHFMAARKERKKENMREGWMGCGKWGWIRNRMPMLMGFLLPILFHMDPPSVWDSTVHIGSRSSSLS
jgi:hypothetical protein